MSPYFANAAVFLIHTLFGLYILAVMLRLLLQWVRADFYNPLSQFLVKITNPPLRPLRRIIPGWGGIDLASVTLLLILQVAEIFLSGLVVGRTLGWAGTLVISAAKLFNMVLDIFFFAILIQVILSWVAPGTYNPVTTLLYRLTETVLAPARRIIPAVGGLDLSPILVIIVLQLLKYLIVSPLSDVGMSLG